MVAEPDSATLTMFPHMALVTTSKLTVLPKRPSSASRMGSLMLQEVAATCPSQKATAKNLLDPGSQPATNLSACIWTVGREALLSLCSSMPLHRSLSGSRGVSTPPGRGGKESCHACPAAVMTAGESVQQLSGGVWLPQRNSPPRAHSRGSKAGAI